MINLNQILVLILLCLLIFGDLPKTLNNFKSFLSKSNKPPKKKQEKRELNP